MSWQLASFALLGVGLLAGLAWFEHARPSAKVVSLVATMAALAVVGRIAFAPFPNVKPTTDIVLIAGYAIGAAPGFAVGATTALASNIFFGQGPWTPWQMAAWGLVGVAGGLLGRLMRGREPRRLPLALVCALAGFGYGALLDLYQWTLSATHNLSSYLAVSGSSFPYNLAHAVGNFVFALAIGPAFVRALRRYRRRFEVRWEQPAALAAVVAALLVAAGASAPPQAAASARAARSAEAKALRYIEHVQNTDGGFGGAPGQSSSALYTGWVGLGIAATGHNPRDVRNGKATAITYTRHHMPSAQDVGALERTILLLHAAGVSPRSFGRRDLLSQLEALRRPDGSWEGLVDHTAFGVLALRASGMSTRALRSSALWIEREQNSDGGFGFGTKGGSSDSDDTGSAIQALVAAGRGRKPAVRRAVGFLRHAQHADGGFGQMSGDSSNAQSTAWAVQGLAAAGRNPNALRRNGHTPIGYLTSLQQANGAIRYSRTSAQTPVWVTGQALTALARKPFPIKAPRRRQVGVASATAAAPKKANAKQPAADSAKSKGAVPIAHAAHGKPKSHGQTIAIAGKHRHSAPPSSAAPAATPTATIATATKRARPVSNAAPSTAHDDSRHGRGLGIALGAIAAAMIATGAWLTRRRLRRRSHPA
jgi:squalene-hopene cyclase-like protein/prenyltransferase/squalene oxidase-like repeat protein